MTSQIALKAQTEVPAEASDAATISGWSDRYPATIIRRTAKTIWLQEDRVEQTSSEGFDSYANGRGEFVHFFRNEDAPVAVFTLRDNGRWVRKGEPKRGGQRASIGHRDIYRDPSF